MQIYQPMLFVGLGGTGCRIGAELERRLREELCGPDGAALRDRMPGESMLPYQLPGCLQFVYADLAEDEFGHVESRVVPDRAYLPAAERTYTMVRELVPPYDTYPEVARSLRLSAAPVVEEWIPPAQDEPRVGPLAKGAGQLPTVGRAALFETFRGGLAPARDSLFKAVGSISNSGGQLAQLGGRLRDSVDVFVAFSVAGGTGAGLFFDYLHLVGDVLNDQGYKARIFPLVLMPSAFQDGLGGGRAAELNAARALLDLFRLVDDQNSQVAGTALDRRGIDGALSVRYPSGAEIRLRASTVQTAFLFSLSAGMHRDDLHRSVVSLLLSLIGTDMPAETESGVYLDRNFQSFADSFINSASTRGVPAATGIGKRGVSTSAVASMTVPVEDLADIVSSRLLADAVTEMANPTGMAGENNRELVFRAFQDANIDPLLQRAPLPINSPNAVDGGDAILAMLNTRKRTMEASLATQEQELARSVPDLAGQFNPMRAIAMMIGELGVFRLGRVFMGESGLSDPVSNTGFVKLVESRRGEPAAPPGVTVGGPAPDVRKTKWYKKIRFSDPVVRASVRRQDEWYAWRAQRAWHAAWNEQAPRWDRKLRTVEKEIVALLEGFREHARTEDARFTRRSKALYEPRVGVSYLLPRQGQLPSFYSAVFRRLVSVYADQNRLHATATPAQVVDAIIGVNGWNAAFAEFQEHGVVEGPGRAVAVVRGLVKTEVMRLFRYTDDMNQPLLASLHDLLAAAAGRTGTRGSVNDDDLAQFREKLAGLVPGGFAPAGRGRLKILLSYPSPAGKRDAELEKFLRQEVNLPRDVDTIPEFRPIDAESIAVVLFRSSMGITEVPEVRRILAHWADAVADNRKNDFLQWRQRTGYRFGYLATSQEDRTRILHHILCAAWNGYLECSGDLVAPKAVNVYLGDSEISMRLDLVAYGRLSSWASLISEYERWVLADSEQIRQDFGDRLMDTRPNGLSGDLTPPAPVFRALMDLAAHQVEETSKLLAENKASGRRKLEAVHEFWTVTFRDALQLRFRGAEDAHQENLEELYEWALR
ncbi:tubulin-like doman-containing protein [Actinokineospora enzanensis]|uniref:tubulin-like doman-containing protein n=1 Tax=Actinokineospora enzanensis TaxID=155975 RepID=UPI00039A7178|nr:tubulin-like doman-containing protein [Actinokineospora enzanensis]